MNKKKYKKYICDTCGKEFEFGFSSKRTKEKICDKCFREQSQHDYERETKMYQQEQL